MFWEFSNETLIKIAECEFDPMFPENMGMDRLSYSAWMGRWKIDLSMSIHYHQDFMNHQYKKCANKKMLMSFQKRLKMKLFCPTMWISKCDTHAMRVQITSGSIDALVFSTLMLKTKQGVWQEEKQNCCDVLNYFSFGLFFVKVECYFF